MEAVVVYNIVEDLPFVLVFLINVRFVNRIDIFVGFVNGVYCDAAAYLYVDY